VRLRVIDGCPVPASIAPYVYLVLRDAKQTANSIYRGEDAKAVLHAHGKRTQAEIHRDLPAISNPPGFSSHELRGDGVTGPRGERLPEWAIGVDSGSDTQASMHALAAAAGRRGWTIWHPYKRGVEAHHWSFRRRPRPRGPKQLAHLVAARARLPRK
jgi:hypothetical protein